MKTNKITQITRNIAKKASDNSPTILTGMAIAGVVTTSVLAVRSTPKALHIIDAENHSRYQDGVPEMGKLEVVQATWKCYIPSVLMGTATIACMVGATTVSHRRNAALAGIYTITENTLKEYQDQIVETVGEEKAEDIKASVAQKTLDKDPITDDREVIITGNGETLCYDSLSGRYFKSDIEKIKKAQNDINKQLISEMWCPLNSLYSAMGLDGIAMGTDLGWNVDELIDMNFTSKLAKDGQPCLVIEHLNMPTGAFRNF